MLYVALAELGVIALLISASSALIRSLVRSHARREDQLLDKALHAAGRPWTPAPADERPAEHPDWDSLLEERLAANYNRFTLTPEQEP